MKVISFREMSYWSMMPLLFVWYHRFYHKKTFTPQANTDMSANSVSILYSNTCSISVSHTFNSQEELDQTVPAIQSHSLGAEGLVSRGVF